jgi:D-lactate dehydrogenase
MSNQLSLAIGPGRLLSRPLDRLAHAGDASFYRLVPKSVVFPEKTEDIASLFQTCRENRTPLAFRAAGTSLSGQAVTDGILADLSRDWKTVEILDEGCRVRVEPGVIGGHVNRLLKPYGRKIGPDPASIDACMIGGILANNASGMCCGVRDNAYHTVESLKYLIPHGFHVIDTGCPEVEEQFAVLHPELRTKLLELQRRVRESSELTAKIRSKYRIKNTVGYALNAFLDEETPAKLLGRLMIGSEGTLGFIAEAVFRTVPDPPLKMTGLLFFPTVAEACDAIGALRDSGAAAIELMDWAALRSIRHQPGAPEIIPRLSKTAAALLVEHQCGDAGELSERRRVADEVLKGLSLLAPVEFTDHPYERAALWKIRKGMYPSVGAARARGTAVIIEDVAVPVGRLAVAVTDLQGLFIRHGYADTIIFGHAKDGNIHFVMTQSFNETREIQRYEAFMADVVDLIAVRHGGSLKAEHGTGRNMAPFVETEWGGEAYRIMRELKAAVDPENILNPGVIITDDPRAHLKNLKSLPTVEPTVDKCIECGFCEHVCPSRDLTLTPRQRIAVRRERARLLEQGDAASAAELAAVERAYLYDGLDTCATDGLCATVCPVGIDTGELVKQLRAEHAPERARRFALALARHPVATERLAGLGVRLGHAACAAFGESFLHRLTRVGERVTGATLPKWNPKLGTVARLPKTERARADAVYFPACVTRLFGEPRSGGAPVLFVEVAQRAGINLWIPPDVVGTCCGMPFSSKGYEEAFQTTAIRTAEKLRDWTDHGRLPVVTDASSCAFTFQSAKNLPERAAEIFKTVRVLDAVEYAHDALLPHLAPRKVLPSAALHPVCSLIKMGTTDKLSGIAAACAERVVVPENAGCCGFAGDRGLLFPELTRSATAREAEEVARLAADGFYSSNPMCEAGMRGATDRPYESFLALLERATRP